MVLQQICCFGRTAKQTHRWFNRTEGSVMRLFGEQYIAAKKTNNIYVPLMVLTHLHYCDVIMGAMTSQITGLTIVYPIDNSDTDQRKHQSSAPLCAGNSPLTGEFPAQMASNAENVSIWWCHYAKANSEALVYCTSLRWSRRWTVQKVSYFPRLNFDFAAQFSLYHSLSHFNSLWPGGTKPLRESMLKIHQWVPVAFTWGRFLRKCSKISIHDLSLKLQDYICAQQLCITDHLCGEFVVQSGQ